MKLADAEVNPQNEPIKAAIAVNIKSKNGETIILVFKP